MTCQIVSSNPRHRGVSWLRDGAPLLAEETPTLTLPQVTRKMSGQYQCKAHNDVGSEKSEAVDLQVHCEPAGSWGGARPGVSRGAFQAHGRGAPEASAHRPPPQPPRASASSSRCSGTFQRSDLLLAS